MASKSDYHNMSEDVKIEILLRLPVKSLVRFKCVCKYWYTFIRSSTFVKEHLHHHNNNARLLVQHYNYSTATYAFALYPDEMLASFPLVYYDVDDIQLPSQPNIMGPCDGIIGLWEWDRMALWNPARREFRPLPMPHPSIPPGFSPITYNFGFGLDPTTNEYKVVWIRRYWDSEKSDPYDFEVIVVYYLSTNSSRLFEVDLSRISDVHDSLCSTCLNGIYYWLTCEYGWNDQCYPAILTFDLSNEVFGDIPAPQDIPRSKLEYLIMYNDSIGVICFNPNEIEKYFDIWVMKEEGCWTIELSIGPLVDVDRALGFWKNGELFLETSTSELVLYNPNTQEIKEFRHRGQYNSLKIFLYKESLVSIKGGNECWKGDNVLNTVQVQDFFTLDSPIVFADQTAHE